MSRPDSFYTDFSVFMGAVVETRRERGPLNETWLNAVSTTIGVAGVALAAESLGAIAGITAGLFTGPLGLVAAAAAAKFALNKRKELEKFQTQIRRVEHRFHELQPLLASQPEHARGAIDELSRQLVEGEDVYA